MRTIPNIPDPDAFYEALLDAHAGLQAAESHALNARLVLLLANQIGDQGVLLSCLETARDTATQRRNDP
ncbi:DUF2783 domain-containing protein [Niveispirillum sp.]|uniref:DUF2783 domain-containing protein n=1 Tax=Niveispirillum sp. TaxID=1917217 RepID=UPI001B6A3726|nr:DUF2783 domain-containing protein [Niveispirillum sp.]MBP7340386.1 DUF2783 domain-containing protein [Niveispirillum sp.]